MIDIIPVTVYITHTHKTFCSKWSGRVFRLSYIFNLILNVNVLQFQQISYRSTERKKTYSFSEKNIFLVIVVVVFGVWFRTSSTFYFPLTGDEPIMSTKRGRQGCHWPFGRSYIETGSVFQPCFLILVINPQAKFRFGLVCLI